MMTDYRLHDGGADGPAGFEWETWVHERTVVAFVFGSDHMTDWLHHITPFARDREIHAALEIAETIEERVHEANATAVSIAGLSLGGCLAEMATSLLRSRLYLVSCVTWGSKRVPRGLSTDASRWVLPGDIVPQLPPWRPGLACLRITADRRPFWRAHSWHGYNDAFGVGMKAWREDHQ